MTDFKITPEDPVGPPRVRDLPAEPVAEEVRAAYRWWVDEREGWPLARALPVWLVYVGNYQWDVDREERVAYDAWYNAVIAEANRNDWK